MANLKVIRATVEARLKALADKAAKKKAADIEKEIRNFYKEFPTPGREMDKETPQPIRDKTPTNEPRRPIYDKTPGNKIRRPKPKKKPKKSDYI